MTENEVRIDDQVNSQNDRIWKTGGGLPYERGGGGSYSYGSTYG